MSQTRPQNIGIVLFDGFELLDVLAPQKYSQIQQALKSTICQNMTAR